MAQRTDPALGLLNLAERLEDLAEDAASVAWEVDDPRLRAHLSRSIQDFRGAARHLRAQVIPAAPTADVIDIQ